MNFNLRLTCISLIAIFLLIFSASAFAADAKDDSKLFIADTPISYKIAPGQTYKVSGWMMADTPNGYCYLNTNYPYNISWQPIRIFGATDWRYYSTTFTVPTGCDPYTAQFSLTGYPYATGNCHWRNVTIAPIIATAIAVSVLDDIDWSALSKGPSCSKIDVQVFDVTMNEKETKSFNFYINNNSDEDFEIKKMDEGELSLWSSAKITRKPTTIKAGEKDYFTIQIKTGAVPWNADSHIRVKVNGEYEGGKDCGYLSTIEAFKVNIRNGTSDNDNDNSDDGNDDEEPNESPRFTGTIPDQHIDEDASRTTNLVYLPYYVIDDTDSSDRMAFTLRQANPNVINCYINAYNRRYIDCDAPKKTGVNTITVTATDSKGASISSSFKVIVDKVEKPIPENNVPRLSGLPDLEIEKNDARNENLLDLWDYASDAEDDDADLKFGIVSQTNSRLISCFIDDDRHFGCNAPRTNSTGTSTILVEVEDSKGLFARDTFKVSVTATRPGNSQPELRGLQDVEVEENSGNHNNIADLWEFAFDSEDDGRDLFFEITNQSNPRLINCYIDNSQRYIDCDAPRFNSQGSSNITVRATDSQGLADSDDFTITVLDDDPNDRYEEEPVFRQIPGVEIEENSGYSSRLIDLWDYASDDEDSDSELDYRIMSQSNTSLIRCIITSNKYFECEKPRGDKTGISTIRLEAEDSDGLTGTTTFNVKVVSEFGGSASCGDIFVETDDIEMDESSSETARFRINNNGESDFYVTDVSVKENNSYLTIRNTDYDNRILEGSDGKLTIDLRSASVSKDTKVEVEIEVKGYFENGKTCSFSDTKRETFEVEIRNDNGSSSGNGDCSDIRVRTRDLSMDESDSEDFEITIENNGDSDFRIRKVELRETSSYLTIRNIDYDSRIMENDDGQIEFRAQSTSVSSDKEAEVTLRIEGEFEDGDYCYLGDIEEKFSITIEED